MIYTLCLALFLVGLYGVLVKNNMIKIIIGLAVMESAAIALLVLLGHGKSGADPLVHEVAVGAVLVAVAVIAVAGAIARRLHEKYGSYDIKDIRKLKG